MPIFSYTSVDKVGKKKKGVLEATSLKDVRIQLRALNLTPIDISAEKESSQGVKQIFVTKKKVSVGTLALFTYQFATLLSAGLTVEAALLNLSSQLEKTPLKSILLSVRARVLEGHTLAYGMNEYPDAFPELYRATIAAGDKSGKLNDVVMRLSAYLEQQEVIRQKVKQAMIYPALLTLVSFSIITFLLVYAMPKITSVFAENGQTLPSMTLFLLDISHGLTTFGPYMLVLIIIAIFAFKRSMKNETFRYKFHSFLIKIPGVNQTLFIVNSARFSRTFGILFTASVPVLEAMTAANNTVALLPMREAISKAIVRVGEGIKIHQALSDTGYFSQLSTQLIASGEISGKVDLMLEKSSAYQELQISRWISTTLSLFEPAMILFMGVVVLFIVIAILLPIFQMNDFFG